MYIKQDVKISSFYKYEEVFLLVLDVFYKY